MKVDSNAHEDARLIDLVSDTVTLPTDEMMEAMQIADVGDDVLEEDPTINQLESLAAEMMGKEAALFVPSGTMGNLVAIMTHCQKGQEVIVERTSHIYDCEVGGISSLAGLVPNTIDAEKGIFDPIQIERKIRTRDIHNPDTGLICLENSHNRQGGTVTPLEKIQQISEVACKHNVPLHLDGARIFNAATFLNINHAEIAKYFDSIMFCLSKGLCAPVGSMLAGSQKFITRARKNRKMLGGGMRQAGILAAAGIIALKKMTGRLQEDHEKARSLAEGLAKIDGIILDMERVQTNMVFIHLDKLGVGSDNFMEKLSKFNIRGSVESSTEVRFVTHYGISNDNIKTAIIGIEEVVRSLKENNFFGGDK